MAKQNGSKPKLAQSPVPGVSVKLRDYLANAAESAKPPSTAGRSTGNLPQNRRGGK